MKYIVTKIINSTYELKSKSDTTEDTIFEWNDRSVGKKKVAVDLRQKYYENKRYSGSK